MEAILEIYKRDYDSLNPVVCFDESNKQQVKEVRDPLPTRSGSVAKYESEYERNGVSNLFMIFEPLKGWRSVEVTDRRTKIDWAKCMKRIVDEIYPNALKITLIMDNLNTHSPSALYEAFSPKEALRISEKLDIQYTPKHGSWLNMAEIEFSALSRQCLKRRIPDQKTMRQEIDVWTKERNENRVVCNWRFTTEKARVKLKKLYPDFKYKN